MKISRTWRGGRFPAIHCPIGGTSTRTSSRLEDWRIRGRKTEGIIELPGTGTWRPEKPPWGLDWWPPIVLFRVVMIGASTISLLPFQVRGHIRFGLSFFNGIFGVIFIMNSRTPCTFSKGNFPFFGKKGESFILITMYSLLQNLLQGSSTN